MQQDIIRAALLAAVIVASTCCFASHGAVLRLISASCGARIPTDSVAPWESEWALQDLMEWRNTTSTAGLSFSNTLDVPGALLTAMERATGTTGKHLTIFSIVGNPFAACSVTWEPREALFLDTVITAVSIAVLPAGYSSCSLRVLSSGTPPLNRTVSQIVNPATDTSTAMEQTILFAEGMQWPLVFSVGAGCTVNVLLAINREVPLDEWWSWIPTAVYSGVVMPIAVVSAFSRRRVSASSFSLMLGLVFVGYLGCSIGLMVSLSGWQVTVGRFFPFPDSVTFYICMWLGYAVLLPGLLLQHSCRDMLLNAVFRAELYGIVVAHVVSYWTSGFVAVGSVGIALLLLTNAFLIFSYSRFVALLSSAKEMEEEFRSMPMSWLAPFSPFVPPVLMYADLFFAHHTPNKQLNMCLREAAALFNIQTAIPFAVFFVGGGAALLVASTTRQATLLVALFQYLLLAGWYVMWSLLQLLQARRQWRVEEISGTKAARLWSLWPAIQTLVDRFNAEKFNKQRQSAVSLQPQNHIAPREAVDLSSRPKRPPPPMPGTTQSAASRSSSGMQPLFHYSPTTAQPPQGTAPPSERDGSFAAVPRHFAQAPYEQTNSATYRDDAATGYRDEEHAGRLTSSHNASASDVLNSPRFHGIVQRSFDDQEHYASAGEPQPVASLDALLPPDKHRHHHHRNQSGKHQQASSFSDPRVEFPVAGVQYSNHF